MTPSMAYGWMRCDLPLDPPAGETAGGIPPVAPIDPLGIISVRGHLSLLKPFRAIYAVPIC
jgi:hypothetical protein